MKVCLFIAILSVLYWATLPATAKDETLVLYLTFDENSGNKTKDLSGNGNDGEIMGAKWGKGKYGNALEFDAGGKTVVQVSDSPTLNPDKEITYMAWFFSDAFDITRGIISKYTGAGTQRSYNLRLHHATKGALSTEASANGAFQLGVSTTDVHSGAVLKNGQWHHAAITFKGGEFLRMYVDGKLEKESKATATKTLFDNNIPLSIGADFNIGEAKRHFNGRIDEVAIFSRVLSEAEIQKAMEGEVQAVDAVGKLTTTWGALKSQP